MQMTSDNKYSSNISCQCFNLKAMTAAMYRLRVTYQGQGCPSLGNPKHSPLGTLIGWITKHVISLSDKWQHQAAGLFPQCRLANCLVFITGMGLAHMQSLGVLIRVIPQNFFFLAELNNFFYFKNWQSAHDILSALISCINPISQKSNILSRRR